MDPSSFKTNTSKFQFDLERTDTSQRVLMNSLVIRGKQITIYNFFFYNHFIVIEKSLSSSSVIKLCHLQCHRRHHHCHCWIEASSKVISNF